MRTKRVGVYNIDGARDITRYLLLSGTLAEAAAELGVRACTSAERRDQSTRDRVTVAIDDPNGVDEAATNTGTAICVPMETK